MSKGRKISMMEQIKQHTSIRKYQDKPIPQQVMDNIFTAIQMAPSWINGQQYSVIRVTDKGAREQLAALAGNQQYIAETAEFLVFCADFNRIQKACEYEGVKFEVDSPDFLTIATTDVGIAMGQAIVVAESFGLGTVAIGGVRRATDDIIQLLALPKYVFPISGLCIGYPDEQPLVKPRLPREAVIHTNTYKETTREQLEAYNEEMLSYMQKRGTNSTWTQGVANFYSKGYSAYSAVVDSMKKQGFKK